MGRMGFPLFPSHQTPPYNMPDSRYGRGKRGKEARYGRGRRHCHKTRVGECMRDEWRGEGSVEGVEGVEGGSEGVEGVEGGREGRGGRREWRGGGREWRSGQMFFVLMCFAIMFVGW